MNQKSFRFIPWLIFFFVSLISIPFLIWFDFVEIAKFVGIAVTISLVVVLRFWLFRLGKSGNAPRVVLNTNDVFELNQLIPALSSLPSKEQLAFHHRIGLIMSKVKVKQLDSVELIDTPPKSLAMIGSSLFLLKGLEAKEDLTFELSMNDNLDVMSNQVSISIEGARKLLAEFSEDQIVRSIAI